MCAKTVQGPIDEDRTVVSDPGNHSLFLCFFYVYFLQMYCPNGKASSGTESHYPTYGARWMFYCYHHPPNSDMDCGIFNARMDVNACDCTRGCTDTVRKSALKVDSGRKIPYHTGESNLRRRRADPMIYQLSYIPPPPISL